MTKSIDKKKLELIQEITAIDSVEDLEVIERHLNLMKLTKEHGAIFNGIKDQISIEELVKNQNFQGINRAEFDQLVKELDIQEPIEDLLEMLD